MSGSYKRGAHHVVDGIYKDLVLENWRMAKSYGLGPDAFERDNGLPPDHPDGNRLQRYIYGILERLYAGQKRAPDEAQRFRVMVSAEEEPNAGVYTWTTPPVLIVSKGLFTHLKTEAQLAAVLAHELVHQGVFDSIGHHDVGKSEEALADVLTAYLLNDAGYQRHALLEVARSFKAENDTYRETLRIKAEEANQQEEETKKAWEAARPEDKAEAGVRHLEALRANAVAQTKLYNQTGRRYLRIITDPHPNWDNRIRRLEQVKVIADRDLGEQITAQGTAPLATPISSDIRETAGSLHQKPLMQRYFEAHGYEAMDSLQKIRFLTYTLKEHRDYVFSQLQHDELVERLHTLEYDLSDPQQDAAFDELVDVLIHEQFRFGNYHRREQAKTLLPKDKDDERPPFRSHEYYRQLYDALVQTRGEKALQDFWKERAQTGGLTSDRYDLNQIAQKRWDELPTIHYLGRIRKLHDAQQRFIAATSEEEALHEAKLILGILEHYAVTPDREAGMNESRMPLYIGGLAHHDKIRDFLKWPQFPITPEMKKHPRGTLPPTPWDKHMQWAGNQPEIAKVLALTGLSTDPRMQGKVEEGFWAPQEEIRLFRDFSYKTTFFILNQLTPEPEPEPEKPGPVPYSVQLQQSLQVQKQALSTVNWSDMHTDFQGFVSRYQEALRPVLPLGKEKNLNPRKPVEAPFISRFLAEMERRVKQGTIPLSDAQRFFSFSDHSDQETSTSHTKERVTLRDLKRAQKDLSHLDDWHGTISCGHPYVQFFFNSPPGWFDLRSRLAFMRATDILDIADLHQEKIRKVTPIRQTLWLAPEKVLGLASQEASIHGLFEITARFQTAFMHERAHEPFLLAAAFLMEDRLRHQHALTAEELVMANGVRLMVSRKLSSGFHLTAGLTKQLSKQNEGMVQRVDKEAIPLHQLVKEYRLLSANFHVHSHFIGDPRGLSIFDMQPPLRLAYEKAILEQINKEQDPGTRLAACHELLASGDISLPAEHEEGLLRYEGNLVSPSFREEIYESFCQDMARFLGKDDGSLSYRRKAEKEVEAVFKEVGGIPALLLTRRLCGLLEAQPELAYSMRDTLKKKGLQKLVAHPFKMVIGEVAAEVLKDNDRFRIAFVDFLLQPLSDKSLQQVTDRASKADAWKFLRGISPDGELARESTGDEFVKTRLTQVHHDFWSLPLELRALGLQDVLFPASDRGNARFAINRELAKHFCFPVEAYPTGAVRDAFRAADHDGEAERKTYEQRHGRVFWFGSPAKHLAPVANAGKQAWGHMLDGVDHVTSSTVAQIGTLRNTLSPTLIGRLLRLPDPRNNRMARVFADAYLNKLEPEEQQVILSAMVASRVPGTHEARLGQTIQQVLEAGKAAGRKLAQAIHSHPDTPEDIRQDMKASKSMASPPERWQVAEWMESEGLLGRNRTTGLDLPPITHIGAILGAGSYGVTVEVTRGDRLKTAVTLLRPHVAGQAKREFGLMEEASQEIIDRKPEFHPIRSMVRQAARSSLIETDMMHSAKQVDLASSLYDPLSITVKGEAFTFSVAKMLGVGAGYKETEIVPGKHFNDLTTDKRATSAYLENLSTALLAAEWAFMAQGGCFDEDRHGAQQKIMDHHTGLFDFGGMSLEPMSERQKELFGQVLGRLVRQRGRKPTEVFARAMAELAHDETDQDFLARVQRTGLAQQDYMRHVPQEALIGIISAIMENGIMDATIERSMRNELGPVGSRIFDGEMAKAKARINISHPHLASRPALSAHRAP